MVSVSALASLFLLLATSCFGAENDTDIGKFCSRTFDVTEGTYDPNIPGLTVLPAEYRGEWTDFYLHPFTFFAKYLDGTGDGPKLVLHLQSDQPGNDTNCYVDGACDRAKRNGVIQPSCCYDSQLQEEFGRRIAKQGQQCEDKDSCRVVAPDGGGPLRAQACSATCLSNMTLNILFFENDPGFGGKVEVTFDYQKRRYKQRPAPLGGELFSFPIKDDQEGKWYRSHVVHRVTSASSVSSVLETGFWVRYVQEVERKSLKVGLNGRHEPIIDLDLFVVSLVEEKQTTFNSPRDSFGWYGDEVHGKSKVFVPKLYAFNTPKTNRVKIRVNCSNIMYHDWGQEQPATGDISTCFNTVQCAKGFDCIRNADLPEEVSWLATSKCASTAGKGLEKYYLILVALAALAIIVVAAVIVYVLYRNKEGVKKSVGPGKEDVKKNVEPGKVVHHKVDKPRKKMAKKATK